MYIHHPPKELILHFIRNKHVYYNMWTPLKLWAHELHIPAPAPLLLAAKKKKTEVIILPKI